MVQNSDLKNVIDRSDTVNIKFKHVTLCNSVCTCVDVCVYLIYTAFPKNQETIFQSPPFTFTSFIMHNALLSTSSVPTYVGKKMSCSFIQLRDPLKRPWIIAQKMVA